MELPFANPDAARTVAGPDAAALNAEGLSAFAEEAMRCGMDASPHDGRDPYSPDVRPFNAADLGARTRMRLLHSLGSRGLADAARLLSRACRESLRLEARRRGDGVPVLCIVKA